MIIRNPYGFIVKHYRLINMLLLIPMIYLAFKFGDIATFFRDYVGSGYKTAENNFADTYVTGLSYLVSFFLLISNGILYYVLATKKKNSIYHISSILVYIIGIAGLLLFHTSMRSIETYTMDITFANFVKDMANICSFPLYILIIIGFTKGLGFNFKTFRLDGNADLKLSEEDEEEIEIKIGSDNNSVKRGSVHLIRELKYYILENKFVFSCIGLVLIFIFGYTWYQEFQVYNKSYTINQAFSLDNFALSVKESYITNLDYRGQVISKDKYYLAIKIGIQNNGYDTKIDKSNFRIFIGNEILYPSYDKASRFIDVGKIYQGEVVHQGQAFDYVFVYELTKDQIKANYEMRILNGLSQKNKKLLKKYRKISIRPTKAIKIDKLGKTKINKEINLKDTTLGNTKYTLKNIEVVSTYLYNYESCNNKNVCNTVTNNIVPSGGKALLIIEDDIVYDENSSYFKNSKLDFYGDFVSVEYEYYLLAGVNSGLKTTRASLVNVTPKYMKDKKVYEVSRTLLNATQINFKLHVRNKEVIIEAKEKQTS